MKRQTRRPETAAVRGAADLEKKNGPVGTPIYQTSTFEVTDNDEQQRVTTTDRYYTRWGNPTNTVAEQAVAAIEGVEAARTFASGMGAITTTILALLKAGDHMVAQRDIYGGRDEVLFAMAAAAWALKRLSSTPTTTSSTRGRSGRIRGCFIWSRRPILRCAWLT